MPKLKGSLSILLIMLAILLMGGSTLQAAPSTTIDDIEMYVYINKDGSARIVEIWRATIYEGTQGSKPYGNLGNSEVINFAVTDDSGRVYNSEPSWNIKGDFDSKKYKNAIQKTSTGIELYWGISQYGQRTYTLSYTITNFVNQYKDSQGIYFSLMPKEMNQPPGSVRITLSSEDKFDESRHMIWAFGYHPGTIRFEEGSIVMDSKGALSGSGYMAALVRIPDGTYDASNKISKTFDDVYYEAMSTVNSSESSNSAASVALILLSIIGVGAPLMAVTLRASKCVGPAPDSVNFGETGKTLPDINSIEYCEDIPCDQDIIRAYWMASTYQMRSVEEARAGIIGAFLLKWLKEGTLSVIPAQDGRKQKKDTYAIGFQQLNLEPEPERVLENELRKMLIEGCGENLILTTKAFEKWCRKNYNRLYRWFAQADNYAMESLEEKGLIVHVPQQVPKFWGGTRTVQVKTATEKMKEEAIELLGFKKVLLDFSQLPAGQTHKVSLWEEYLIFAQVLGIADIVQKQFSELYPEFDRRSKFTSDITSFVMISIAQAGCNAASESYSSGGGGDSFSGGGGGAGGSSSGGGFS
ncbi:MAG: DUF2207 domain-containing protein [Peptococcaceae bacterium]|nr:DUF2207 domain-containing protein [Peptococcaceae bacterium]